MTYIWLAFLGGLMAFPHCVGMCGGFALHFGGGGSRWGALWRQLGWYAGRVMTYAFLGGLAGFLGHRVSLLDWPAVGKAAGYLAGVVTILMGLRMLGLPRRGMWRGRFTCRGRPARASRGLPALANPACRQDVPHGPSHAGGTPATRSALAFGLVNGLLPCPVTLAFLALAAQTASAGLGMAMLAAMGLGTTASLLPAGLAGLTTRAKLKRHGALLLAVLLIALGGWTILRKLNTDSPCCHASPQSTENTLPPPSTVRHRGPGFAGGRTAPAAGRPAECT